MPKSYDEQNIKILHKDSIGITDFSFASDPLWLSTECHNVKDGGLGGGMLRSRVELKKLEH